ncbi:MAG: NUDIX domain-containing protein [Cyanobacteria bacterium P01_E01_bin.6]
MVTISHFEEPGRINRDATDSANFWVPMEIYSTVLDRMVITCVDLLFIHNGKVLLGRRNGDPINGWWVIGGRMFAGESPIDAVQRKAKEEAGLSIGRSPIQFLGVYSTAFATRRQPPVEHGLHSVNLAHIITVTSTEKAQIALTKAEYDTWAWVSQSDINTLLDPTRSLDQFVHRMVTDCWNAMA